jgi:triosephosphate isomerase
MGDTVKSMMSAIGLASILVYIVLCAKYESFMLPAVIMLSIPLSYTGAISPKVLKNIGCEYVIIGHVERREHCFESDEMLKKKIHAAVNTGLTPILCVSDELEDRRLGKQDHVIRRQVELTLEGVRLVGSQKIFVAYDPIWAIGTGKAATPQDITYMHKVIYQALIDVFSPSVASRNTHIIYGGSVAAHNIQSLIAEETINGCLVGGASVIFEQFSEMINIANTL